MHYKKYKTGITLKVEYKETDNKGSFDARGSGFRYVYDSDKKHLHILSSRNRKPILEIPFDHNGLKNPYDYVNDINKATQIYAMMISNNETVDLSNVLDGSKLSSILQSSVRVARYSHYLQTEEFSKFSRRFSTHSRLHVLKIKRIIGRTTHQDVYVGKLRTKKNGATKAVSTTLHGAIKDLSEQTIRDLLSTEQWSVHQHDAHNLLSVSTNLATISHILNERFSPHKRISKYASMSTSDLLEGKENTTKSTA